MTSAGDRSHVVIQNWSLSGKTTEATAAARRKTAATFYKLIWERGKKMRQSTSCRLSKQTNKNVANSKMCVICPLKYKNILFKNKVERRKIYNKIMCMYMMSFSFSGNTRCRLWTGFIHRWILKPSMKVTMIKYRLWLLLRGCGLKIQIRIQSCRRLITTRSTFPPGSWENPSDSGKHGRTRQTGTRCQSLCSGRGRRMAGRLSGCSLRKIKPKNWTAFYITFSSRACNQNQLSPGMFFKK